MKTPGKNMHNIITFLLLTLIWNLECLKLVGPSRSILKKVEKCDSSEGLAIQLENYRITKYNKTVYTYNGNIEFQTELTDNDTEINITVEMWKNRQWRPNFVKMLKNACSSVEQIAPNFFQSIVKQSNNITDCQIPVGNYEFKNLVINVDMAGPYLYGLYRYRLEIFKNGILIFCIRYILDVVPLE